jgi:acyl-CoA synthetase (NDP forming)/GNAT superfamily N-acetyltransferase
MTRPVDEVGVYALLTDGATVEIRPAQAEDYAAVHDMHAAMSPVNTYLRFFDPSSRAAAREAQRVCRKADGDHAALLAWLGGQLIGVASYERTRKPGIAEIAFAVADHIHSHGVATLLLEHLVSVARKNELAAFTAEVLAANADMAGVLTDAGLPVQRRAEEGMIEFTLRLAADGGRCLDSYLNAVDFREAHAIVVSLRHLLLPRSVAVVGTSQQRRASGQAILRKIAAGGFRGSVYAVSTHVPEIAGVTCVPSVSDLPEPVDLAVVTVPPGSVLPAAHECGRRGVKALIVTTPGLDAGQHAGLLAACRRHGMRLAGPNSFGVATPTIGLDATFAMPRLVPGKIGLVAQSGGPGRALADRLSRLGAGMSSFVSVGDECDVSANDMLMWWEQDGLTRLAVLFTESFGNPRKFARTARRIGLKIPVLTVHAAGSAGPLVGAASLAALFEQAGIIATRGLDELLESVAFLVTQPVPAGGRVCLISNADAAASAAAACAEAGLIVHMPARNVQRQAGEAAPPGDAATGPVRTTAAATQDGFRRCLELAAAGHDVDAALVVVSPSATAGDLVKVICKADVCIPFAAVVLGQQEAVRLLPVPAAGISTALGGEARYIPAYAHPASAARALANAGKYGAWSARPPGGIPEFDDLRPTTARTLVRRFLAQAPAGGWLPRADARQLFSCYGLAVEAYLVDSDETRRAVRPMVTDGIEVIISVIQDPTLGAMIIFRLGGTAAKGQGDPAARMTPLTDADADDLIRAIGSPPSGWSTQGTSALETAALRETVLRVSHLADDLPQVAELHLDPVFACLHGVVIRGASARLAPAQSHDLFLRRLP